MNQGTLNIKGGTIYLNETGQNGGGISISGGTVNMTGGTITDNRANARVDENSGYGGGVRIGSGAKFTIGPGVIKKNRAETSSGGISKHSSGTYVRNTDSGGTALGRVCKNNNPTNSYDTSATTDSQCQ